MKNSGLTVFFFFAHFMDVASLASVVLMKNLLCAHGCVLFLWWLAFSLSSILSIKHLSICFKHYCAPGVFPPWRLCLEFIELLGPRGLQSVLNLGKYFFKYFCLPLGLQWYVYQATWSLTLTGAQCKFWSFFSILFWVVCTTALCVHLLSPLWCQSHP